MKYQTGTVRESIEVAVMPAAGTGNRLKPYTDQCPKCMVPVNGRPLLDYTLDALAMNGYKKLIMVTGFMAGCVQEHLEGYSGPLELELVHNNLFDQTNNIYSLWLGMQKLNRGFTIVESDLIFEPDALRPLKEPDTVALDLYDPLLHRGTTASVDGNNFLKALHTGRNEPSGAEFNLKTVNIWSLSAVTASQLLKKIECFIEAGDVHCFYELAIKTLVEEGIIRFHKADFSRYWWDEIDTVDDLQRVSMQTGQQVFSMVV
jgi:L-glutamine-phosphate cytidylyltransferase